MQNQLAVAAIVLAGVSTAVAGYAVMENKQLRVQLEERKLIPSGSEGDLAVALAPEERGALEPLPADVEKRLRAVEERVEAVDKGLAVQEQEVAAAKAEARRAADGAGPAAGQGGGVDVVAGGAKTEQELKQLINKAVDAKAEKMARKWNKKPKLDYFADQLQLTDVQKEAVQREVLRGQREIKELLETPLADGTVLLDDLVETMAQGMAKPNEAETGAAWMRFIAKASTEKIPGTDDTYLARIEGVKQSVKDGFKRDMSPEQYKEFEEWEMDPTEIEEVPDSPWKEVETQVFERAKELGWENPTENEEKK